MMNESWSIILAVSEMMLRGKGELEVESKKGYTLGGDQTKVAVAVQP